MSVQLNNAQRSMELLIQPGLTLKAGKFHLKLPFRLEKFLNVTLQSGSKVSVRVLKTREEHAKKEV